MPDWRPFVEQRFAMVNLDPDQRAEVVAELASHLEEIYEALHGSGVSERQAIDQALAEVADWDVLVRRIERAKREDKVNQRTRSIWIPGLLTAALGTVALAGVQRAGLQPHIVWLRSGLAFMLYVPWLISLPFIGAFGAYASRRVGGGIGERISSGLFPAFAIVCSLCVAAVYAVVIDHVASHFMALGVTIFLLNWVVLPAAALLIGALPFLGGTKLEQAS